VRAPLVEDDPSLALAVRDPLRQAGFVGEWLAEAESADAVLSSTDGDLDLLYIGLPGMSGLDLLRRLRHRGNNVPVLMLTARERYNGGRSDIDEVNVIDRKASDNNTLMLFLWTAL
jgi:DNA-binding response OmpR family regulator